MELTIKNLAKVEDANIQLNGITIVAGANNTGKSTLGKALWAIISAFSNLERRIRAARERKYRELLEEFDSDVLDWDGSYDSDELSSGLVDGSVSVDSVRSILVDECSNAKKQLDIVDKWVSKIEEVGRLREDELKRQEVYNTFDRVFNSQFDSFIRAETHPYIELNIEGKKMSVQLTEALPVCCQETKLVHRAYYFDTAETLGYLAREPRFWRKNVCRHLSVEGRLIQDIVRDFDRKRDANVVDDLLDRKRFAKVEGLLKDLMGGSLEQVPGKGVMFLDKLFPDKPLRIANLSQGIKSMAFLQAAFKNGTIQEGDVLILDEPEIHLHPNWQIDYAEFLVLLQKEFGLTLLVSSHSPDFVQAVRLYAAKHGMKGRIDCYLSRVLENGAIRMGHVRDGDWDSIFESFGSSFDRLMALRQELRLDEEESCESDE